MHSQFGVTVCGNQPYSSLVITTRILQPPEGLGEVQPSGSYDIAGILEANITGKRWRVGNTKEARMMFMHTTTLCPLLLNCLESIEL